MKKIILKKNVNYKYKWLHLYAVCMTDRIVFRPTEALEKRINDLLASGRYKTKSDLIRHALWYGVCIMEKETDQMENRL